MPLSLGGDGRCDTPGHSAKFCSYTMLDVNLMVVADIQLVQVYYSAVEIIWTSIIHRSGRFQVFVRPYKILSDESNFS